MEDSFPTEAATANDSPNPDAPKQMSKRNGRAKVKTTGPAEKSRPGPATLSRTKKLVLAAIKVWELKRGIRD